MVIRKPTPTTAQVLYFQNRGQGNFSNSTIVPVALSSIDTAVVADFNSDGLPDIVVASATSNLTLLYLSQGNGNFSNSPRQVSASISTKFLRAGDLNGYRNCLVLFIWHVKPDGCVSLQGWWR